MRSSDHRLIAVPAAARATAGRLAAALLGAALVVAGCGGQIAPSAGGQGASPSAIPSSIAIGLRATSAPATTPVGATASGEPSGAAASSDPSGNASAGSQALANVTATLLRAHLPVPLSRAVVAADNGTVLVMGGLDAAGTTGTIVRIDPGAGTARRAGHLSDAVHDAAGAPLRGSWLVIGGGRTLATAVVQRVSATGSAAAVSAVVGSLPAPRADGAAVAVGGRVLLVGGGRGGVPDSAVLATSDGVHFTRIGRLAVPVRYGAVAAFGGFVYVFGGSTARGDTDAIQRIDPATGAVQVIGRLPRTMSEATSFVLDGRVLIAGGMHAGRPSTEILAFDPATRRVVAVGRLPEAVADAGAAVIGTTAYVVGGETGTAYLASVIAIR